MPIKFGIIGTGGMANAHADHLKKIRGVRLEACLDLDLERAEAYRVKHGLRYRMETVDRLLDAVDAVCIVTSDASHAPLSLQVLKAGKHLLCEKPLTVTLAEARRVAAAYRKARAQGVIGMINFSHRGRHSERAAAMVARGDLGEIRLVRSRYLQGWLAGLTITPGRAWRLQTAMGSAGVLGDLGCHILDFTTLAVGPVKRLRCSLRTHPKLKPDGKPYVRVGGAKLDANDTAAIHLDFANGAFGTVETTRWAVGHGNDVELEIAGTGGAIALGHANPAEPWMRFAKCGARSQGDWQPVRLGKHISTWQHFVEAIRTGEPAQPDLLRGAEIQALLDACQRSAVSGEAVRPGKTG